MRRGVKKRKSSVCTLRTTRRRVNKRRMLGKWRRETIRTRRHIVFAGKVSFSGLTSFGAAQSVKTESQGTASGDKHHHG